MDALIAEKKKGTLVLQEPPREGIEVEHGDWGVAGHQKILK